MELSTGTKINVEFCKGPLSLSRLRVWETWDHCILIDVSGSPQHPDSLNQRSHQAIHPVNIMYGETLLRAHWRSLQNL